MLLIRSGILRKGLPAQWSSITVHAAEVSNLLFQIFLRIPARQNFILPPFQAMMGRGGALSVMVVRPPPSPLHLASETTSLRGQGMGLLIV